MSDDNFFVASRILATAAQTMADKLALDSDETVALAGAALSEVMAQHLGVFGTVERLRNMADVFEQQAFSDANN